MQVSSTSRSTTSDHTDALTAALELIANGSGDDKLRFVAERDPDWFVDHVLAIDYTDRDAVLPQAGRIDRRLLDQAIARLALRDRAAAHAPAAPVQLAS